MLAAADSSHDQWLVIGIMAVVTPLLLLWYLHNRRFGLRRIEKWDELRGFPVVFQNPEKT